MIIIYFDPVGHRLTGERTSKSYNIGDSIRIIVARVDLDERKIDFVLESSNKEIPEGGEGARKPARSSAKKLSRLRTGSTKKDEDKQRSTTKSGKKKGSRKRRTKKKKTKTDLE